MDPAELKELLNAAPFVPFVIYLSDGRAFTVPHPELVSLSPMATTMRVFADESF